ncbi:hypothetical protein THAOC_27489, partial [Thalassiosira oceanica]
ADRRGAGARDAGARDGGGGVDRLPRPGPRLHRRDAGGAARAVRQVVEGQEREGRQGAQALRGQGVEEVAVEERQVEGRQDVQGGVPLDEDVPGQVAEGEGRGREGQVGEGVSDIPGYEMRHEFAPYNAEVYRRQRQLQVRAAGTPALPAAVRSGVRRQAHGRKRRRRRRSGAPRANDPAAVPVGRVGRPAGTHGQRQRSAAAGGGRPPSRRSGGPCASAASAAPRRRVVVPPAVRTRRAAPGTATR